MAMAAGAAALATAAVATGARAVDQAAVRRRPAATLQPQEQEASVARAYGLETLEAARERGREVSSEVVAAAARPRARSREVAAASTSTM